MPPEVEKSLADATRQSVWAHAFPTDWDFPTLTGQQKTDLVVVGSGFTGLWTAILAKTRQPERDVVVVEKDTLGHAASSRNGGFISESLTHGHAHGQAMWPDEMATLVELGRENMRQIRAFISDYGIDAEWSDCGKTAIAVTPVQAENLKAVYEINTRFGEAAELLNAEQMREDVASPTYLGGVRVRTGSGLFHPVKMLVGMVRVAQDLGVRFYQHSPVTALQARRTGLDLVAPQGRLRAHKAVLATSVFSPLVGGIKARVLPLFDHVLATEPLSAGHLDSLRWRESQGLTDLGNQFHYYRKTADNRIVWGGYDANYYFGDDSSPRREVRDASHTLLAKHFFDTFPQLEGVRFEYQWAGVIDSTSRFTPYFSTALGGRVASALGFTGLGTGSSRFGATVALDLLDDTSSPLRRLEMVAQKPLPFPPEPFRYPLVQFTRWSLVKEDETGRRNLWLRLLESLKVGFNS